MDATCEIAGVCSPCRKKESVSFCVAAWPYGEKKLNCSFSLSQWLMSHCHRKEFRRKRVCGN